MGTLSLITLIIVIIVGIVIFLALREVNCWYWEINRHIELLKETNHLLKQLLDKNGNLSIIEIEPIIEQTSINDSKVMEQMFERFEIKRLVQINQ